MPKIVEFDVKVLALDMYRNEGWKMAKACETFGITSTSILRYKKEIGLIIYGLIDKYEGDVSKVTSEEYEIIRYGFVKTKPKVKPGKPKTEFEKEIEEVREQFERNDDLIEGTYQEIITDAKIIAVDKLRARIKAGTPKTISAREITDALRLLNEIDSRDDTAKVGDPKTVDEYAFLLAQSYIERSKDKKAN